MLLGRWGWQMDMATLAQAKAWPGPEVQLVSMGLSQCVLSADWASPGGGIRRAQITYLRKLQDSTGFPDPELSPLSFTHLVHTVWFLVNMSPGR